MPDLNVSRHDVMARPVLKSSSQSSGLDSAYSTANNYNNSLFQHDKQKMTMANSFFQAIIKGNVNKVRNQLNRGHNINTKNDYGMSPLVASLHIEDDSRRARMFYLLLEKGASYKARDTTHDRPALHWACVLGQTPEVQTLLEETAGDIKLSEKDGDGFTALHHAVKIGSLPIVQNLVNYHVRFGITVDLPDKMGLTPYIHARRLGYRDVANILREQGQASIGHGDNFFRSPREWSMIGKFERKKAIELTINDQVNAAKIMGKLGLAHIVGNSPRMAVPGIVVPSLVPEIRPRPANLGKKKINHISVSLPSLNDAIDVEDTPRPNSTDKGIEHESNFKPGLPRVAFENDSNKSSVYSYSSTTNHGSISHRAMPASTAEISIHKPPLAKINPGLFKSTKSSQRLGCIIDSNSKGSVFDLNGNFQGLNNPMKAFLNDSIIAPSAPCGTNFVESTRSSSNLGALSLLEQSSFQKGRPANSFHQSHFDESKASEYKHMMGNLNSIMDVLSQQQTKSFRQSVQVKKMVTPPKKKKKNKVSTLAIIFGQKRSAKRRGRKSPKSLKSSRQKGEKDGNSKGKNSQASDGKLRTSHHDTAEAKAGKANKLPVPTIKIN
ncbi:ankyrin repeat domain-containing protein 50 [Plakobranchus ocellatus]|uniref:Ankyrin repeat domain-containing protein 50 n=1 Tax=Plakobranchus ocellatus TaxID=259542 RepID=A0AAV3ZP68_9GAST|nr:ankyrin repeat domain-containing protein 50 [Plakobranchus ocellatus]